MQARTASGDVDLSAVASGEVDLVSASGDLAVAVVPGISAPRPRQHVRQHPQRTRRQRRRRDASDAAVQISCRTLSGDIRTGKARGAAAQPAAPAGPADAADAADAGEPDAIGR